MKYNLGLIAILLTLLPTTTECIDFGNLFGWFQKPFNTKKSIASNCQSINNRRKCKFDATSLKLDIDSALDMNLVVNSGGRTITCTKKLNKGSKQWYGNCDGDADDANFITRVDKNGKESVFGSIRVGNDICHISPNTLGEEEIECIPTTEFKVEIDSPHAPNEKGSEKFRMLTSDTIFGFDPAVNQSKSQSSLRGSNQNVDAGRELFDDSGGNIDIMVIWTTAAECSKAGLLPNCTVTETTQNIMLGFVDLAIDETNTAYELSGIFARLRLVHAYRDPVYVEVSDMLVVLNHLTNSNDRFMDDVHSKRALYGADIVQMIVGGQTGCGIGWSAVPSAEYMFGVTHYDCTTGYYSFGHEIGHNFGMAHDRGAEKKCSEANTFNYGYKDPNAEFRTIMSYECQIGECDNLPKSGCTRVQRFSNMNTAYTFNNKPIGDAKQDNAKQFNDHRARVASFFPAMNCQSNAECNDNNSNTVDTCNTVNRVCVFAPAKSPTRSPTKAPVKTPTKAPIRAPTLTPVRIKITTEAPVLTTTAPNQPINSPVIQPQTGITNSPTIIRPTSTAPTIETNEVEEPIIDQEGPSTGFFSKLFQFFNRLFSFSWLF